MSANRVVNHGYTCSQDEDGYHWAAEAPGRKTLYARSLRDLADAIHETLAHEYDELRPALARMLTDYRAKLEVDDYDPDAVQKMADVNETLKKLQGK